MRFVNLWSSNIENNWTSIMIRREKNPIEMDDKMLKHTFWENISPVLFVPKSLNQTNVSSNSVEMIKFSAIFK